jgi:hypothetical protein
MKKSHNSPVLLLALTAMALLSFTPSFSQVDYKHPHLNASGQVLDSAGVALGWIKNGIIYNSKGEQIGKFEKQDLVDYKGHKLGSVGKDGTFYDDKGTVVFTVDTKSKGEKCKVFDPQGNVIATVHESYKNQACAIHCLQKKMPAH